MSIFGHYTEKESVIVQDVSGWDGVCLLQNLSKCGYEPAYYINNNGSGRMEIDFVVEFFDGLAAIEVKSGKDRSSPSIGKILDHHHVERRMMLENGNGSRSEGGIEHYLLFAAAFFDELDPWPEYI